MRSVQHRDDAIDTDTDTDTNTDHPGGSEDHEMRRPIAMAALLALGLTLALAPAAAADHDDPVFAAGIRVGDFHLSIGFVPERSSRAYYYRTRDRIHYDGYRCTDRCYRRAGYQYHHERCPVVLHLLHLERLHPHRLFQHHSPSYDGRWAGYDPYAFHRSYDAGHGSYRHHRYDRRYDRHDGYDRRHDRRYDRHDGYDRRHGRRDSDWRSRRHHDRGRHDGWNRGRGHRGHGRGGHRH